MKENVRSNLVWQSLFLLVFLLSCTQFDFSEQLNFKNDNPEMSARLSLPAAVLDSTLRSEKKVKDVGNYNKAADPSISTYGLTAVNYALQASVSAESTYPGYSVNKINDGSTNTTVGPSYSWANNFPAGGKLPESVFLKFSTSKTVGKINIYTSTGYVLQNYTIKYRTTSTGSWTSLISVSGNTSVFRTHTFDAVSLLEVQVLCELGPPNQTIYGRLNEVQIYGPSEPTLPPISVENGMLVFNSSSDIDQAIEYLEYKYDQYTDAFIAQYPGKTTDELADIEELTGFNDEQPYIDFENIYGITSLRNKITTEEDIWLATTAGDETAYPDPDDTYMDDVEIRTLVNSNGEIRVGLIHYIFQSDGSYYKIKIIPKDPISPVYLSTLQNHQPGQVLPAGVELVTPSISIAPQGCKSSNSHRGFKYNADRTWRFKYKLKFSQGPFGLFGAPGKLIAYTKSYKKKKGRWKKRSAQIEAYAYGSIVNFDCNNDSPIETPIEVKKARKVKAKLHYASGVKAKSGALHSSHYHEKVGLYHSTLTW